jgi:hypothetical protein
MPGQLSGRINHHFDGNGTTKKGETVWVFQVDTTTGGRVKHTKRSVQSVRKSAKSLLSPGKIARFTAKNVFQNEKIAAVKVYFVRPCF